MGRLQGHKLDKTDIEIIRWLQKNPLIGYDVLRKLVELGYTPCRRRVKHLIERGYIRHSVIVRRERGLWKHSYCIFVQLTNTSRPVIEEVSKKIGAIKNVEFCLELDGTWDFVVRVNAEDKSQLDLIRDAINGIKNVKNTQSQPINKTVKEGFLPPESLAYPEDDSESSL